jgi:hypothetical protein
MSKAEDYDEDDDIQVYKVSRPNVSYTGNGTFGKLKPDHIDHPARHWDRTCPACVYESDISQKRVDETAKRKHEWVGLTDEEINRCYADTVDEFQFYQAIEAKLKEKNT